MGAGVAAELDVLISQPSRSGRSSRAQPKKFAMMGAVSACLSGRIVVGKGSLLVALVGTLRSM